MVEKSSLPPRPALAGLIFRISKYARFWGWMTPAPEALTLFQTATPPQNSRAPVAAWSNVAEWLKRMHAQADSHPERLPLTEE